MKQKKSPPQKSVSLFQLLSLLSKKVGIKSLSEKRISIIISVITLATVLVSTFLAVKNYTNKFPEIQVNNWGIESFDGKSVSVRVILINTGETPSYLTEIFAEIEPEIRTTGDGLSGGLQRLVEEELPTCIGGDCFKVSKTLDSTNDRSVYFLPDSETPLSPGIFIYLQGIKTPVTPDDLPIMIDKNESKSITIFWKFTYLPLTSDYHLTKMNLLLKFGDGTSITIPILEALSKQ